MQMKLCLPLTSYYVAWALTGHRLVLVHSPGITNNNDLI